jgi:hypothetical protein
VKRLSARNLADYVSVMLLIFFAGGATAVSRSLQTLDNAPAIGLLALVVGALFITHRLGVSKRLLSVLVGFSVYYVLVTIKFQSFHYKFLFLYPFSFLLAYAFVAGMGDRFFLVYERLLVLLSAISIPLWTLQVVSPGAIDVFAKLSPLEPYNLKVGAHLLVFTVVNESVNTLLPRNSGFAWEPGAFAVFVCLAIFINLVRCEFRLRGNWGLLTLLAALLTTQSTTGYSMLLLLSMLWMINVRSKLTLAVAIPFLVLGGFYVLTLPFMYEKIQEIFSEDVRQLSSTARHYWNRDQLIYAQRIASFRIDFMDFIRNPLLGYGGHDESMWTRKEGLNLVSISGIGKVMAKFGLVGLLFFSWSLVRSSKLLASDLGYRGTWVLAVLILQISVSYSLIESPLLMCFWMYALFRRQLPSSKETMRSVHV